MDFALSAKAEDYRGRLQDFMDTRVFPAEEAYEQYRRDKGYGDHTLPPVVEELKAEARSRGLWNLFLPDVSGLTNLEYAPLAEIIGWSHPLAPEAINCDAPDTGNMEVLHMFGTAEQKEQWLAPLLEGEIRSAFAMTEPDVASSDATNISTRIERDGDDYVINGRKWWTTGAADPRCKIMIVMGKTNPDGVLVPPAVDDPRADGHARRRDRAGAAGLRLPRPARPQRDRASPTCACRPPTCSPTRATASRSPRPASVPAASTTACARSASPSARSS